VIVNDTFAPYEVFISAGLMYLAMTYTLTQLFGFIERRLYADKKEAEAAQRLQKAVEA
jgi:octopine/nopaline transport system permease protein